MDVSIAALLRAHMAEREARGAEISRRVAAALVAAEEVEAALPERPAGLEEGGTATVVGRPLRPGGWCTDGPAEPP